MSAVQENTENAKRKRKLEDDEDNENKSKRKQFFATEPEIVPELLDLADEILMEILLKLDGESLHNVAA